MILHYFGANVQFNHDMGNTHAQQDGKMVGRPHTTAHPIIGGGGVKPVEGDDGGRAAAHGTNVEEG